jgi:hypothetical protein
MLVEQAPHHKGRKMLSWMMILHATPRIWQFFVLSIEKSVLDCKAVLRQKRYFWP